MGKLSRRDQDLAVAFLAPSLRSFRAEQKASTCSFCYVGVCDGRAPAHRPGKTEVKAPRLANTRTPTTAAAWCNDRVALRGVDTLLLRSPVIRNRQATVEFPRRDVRRHSILRMCTERQMVCPPPCQSRGTLIAAFPAVRVASHPRDRDLSFSAFASAEPAGPLSHSNPPAAIRRYRHYRSGSALIVAFHERGRQLLQSVGSELPGASSQLGG